jgi:1-deoxy-D-xylulose-5-phosphate reductoisomerase
MTDLIILGSTGSIGLSALRVVDSFPGRFRIKGLSCRTNMTRLRQQIEQHQPALVSVCGKEALFSDEYRSIKRDFPHIEFFEGNDGVEALASQPSDILLSAIVGAAGLRPALAAVHAAKRIALANKETLVMAGDLFMKKVAEAGVELLPVDSEHSAIFALLAKEKKSDLDKIIITASGGSLRDKTSAELSLVTPQQALDHPTWSMGAKITIDSATLMNKGLEVIEAHHLFDVPYDRIDVVVHPESIIHSMIQTVDGAIYAHMSVTDMAFPILNALVYPEKIPNPFGKLDLAMIGALTFRPYDAVRFPALALCYDAGREGGTMPAVLNAANEVAVRAFLDRRISYNDIVRTVSSVMERHEKLSNPDINDIFAADEWARENVLTIL